MNDFVAGRLAHERQADYLRQVAHDELAAEFHRTDGAADLHPDKDDIVEQPTRRWWRVTLGRLAPSWVVGRDGRP
jgi:hypothetical protein